MPAARAPEPVVESAASVTIIDQKRIKRLGDPLVPALLRLVPSISVASSGSAGTVSEVRIRGAEANHTLLFIDGIRAQSGWANTVYTRSDGTVNSVIERPSASSRLSTPRGWVARAARSRAPC